jgi:hypothetical protein
MAYLIVKEFSKNKGRILKKGIFFLSPERAATYQPRATPWVSFIKGKINALRRQYDPSPQ